MGKCKYVFLKIFYVDTKYVNFFNLLGSPQAPQVTLQPVTIDEDEYKSAEVYCSATGNPKPQIFWDRIDGVMSSDIYTRDGYLRFNSLQRSDSGSYRCYAQNSIGDHDQILNVYVRSRQPTPSENVYISPESYTGAPGDEITLSCSASPRGRVTWSKLGAVELPRNVYVRGDEIIIQYSTVDDSGTYVCNVQFPSGGQRSANAVVYITPISNQWVQ